MGVSTGSDPTGSMETPSRSQSTTGEFAPRSSNEWPPKHRPSSPRAGQAYNCYRTGYTESDERHGKRHGVLWRMRSFRSRTNSRGAREWRLTRQRAYVLRFTHQGIIRIPVHLELSRNVSSRLWLSVPSKSLFLAAWLVPACAGNRAPAQQWDLARATEPSGARVYDAQCGTCHGSRGEGARGIPALLGQGALPLQRRGRQREVPFRTAQDVFEYTSVKMPLPPTRAGTLSEREYWSVVSFLVRGRAAPAEAVTPATARSIVIN